MPQETSRGRRIGGVAPRIGRIASVRATALRASVVLRASVGVAVLGIAFMSATAARADDDNPAWSKFMQTLGLKKSPDTQIHYTERSPLVVPPSRDLPPPVGDAATAPDWPKDPNTTRSKQSKKDAVVPGTGPIQTPNPVVNKHWYNPADWFNKEEYGTFAGEPVRADLTDPPAGYRVPSPSQPYAFRRTAKRPSRRQATSTWFRSAARTAASRRANWRRRERRCLATNTGPARRRAMTTSRLFM